MGNGVGSMNGLGAGVVPAAGAGAVVGLVAGADDAPQATAKRESSTSKVMTVALGLLNRW
jgi:hypothetical protein